jgi:hypothetical protein
VEALLSDHAVDQTARPHCAGINVEIVEHAVRIIDDGALPRLEDDLVPAQYNGDPVAKFPGQALLVEVIVSCIMGGKVEGTGTSFAHYRGRQLPPAGVAG